MTDPIPHPALGSTSLDYAAQVRLKAAACPYCAGYRPIAGTDCVCTARCGSVNCGFHAGQEFDGCSRDCLNDHTYEWGRCEHGVRPVPKLSYARQFTSEDGEFGVGFDSALLEQIVPWAAHLPAADQHEMLNEFFDADDADREALLAAWRTTAEQLADPVRRDVLLGESDPADYVEAGRPTPEEFADFDAAIAECRGDGTDWKGRAEKAELDLAIADEAIGQWRERAEKAEADHDRLLADWTRQAAQLNQVHAVIRHAQIMQVTEPWPGENLPTLTSVCDQITAVTDEPEADAVVRARRYRIMCANLINDGLERERDAARTELEQRIAKLAHAESVVDAFHAEADRLSDRYDSLRDDYERLQARLGSLTHVKTEWSTDNAFGPADDFITNEHLAFGRVAHRPDVHRQVVQRKIYAGPWLAAGGVISAENAPVLESGCTYVLPSRADVERQAARAHGLVDTFLRVTGLTPREAGALLGVSANAVNSWSIGAAINAAHRERLADLNRRAQQVPSRTFYGRRDEIMRRDGGPSVYQLWLAEIPKRHIPALDPDGEPAYFEAAHANVTGDDTHDEEAEA